MSRDREFRRYQDVFSKMMVWCCIEREVLAASCLLGSSETHEPVS